MRFSQNDIFIKIMKRQNSYIFAHILKILVFFCHVNAYNLIFF